MGDKFQYEDFKLDFWGYNKSSYQFGKEPSVPDLYLLLLLF